MPSEISDSRWVCSGTLRNGPPMPMAAASPFAGVTVEGRLDAQSGEQTARRIKLLPGIGLRLFQQRQLLAVQIGEAAIHFIERLDRLKA